MRLAKHKEGRERGGGAKVEKNCPPAAPILLCNEKQDIPS